jgi:hypothetical protein
MFFFYITAEVVTPTEPNPITLVVSLEVRSGATLGDICVGHMYWRCLSDAWISDLGAPGLFRKRLSRS